MVERSIIEAIAQSYPVYHHHINIPKTETSTQISQNFAAFQGFVLTQHSLILHQHIPIYSIWAGSIRLKKFFWIECWSSCPNLLQITMVWPHERTIPVSHVLYFSTSPIKTYILICNTTDLAIIVDARVLKLQVT